jgi:mono/diheme cytochrome c family protein
MGAAVVSPRRLTGVNPSHKGAPNVVEKTSLRQDAPMRRSAIRLLVCAALACPWAFAASADERPEGVAAGEAIAREKCARCHAIGPYDRSTHELAPPFRDVVRRYPPENLEEALAEGIVSGHPDMPLFVLEPPEIEAFVDYLTSLSGAKN